MTALLLANAAATFFMVGLIWFVQVVHYPLFAKVGELEFAGYHLLHSSRTTWVVLPAMAIELATSWLLLVEPPAGQTALALAGAILALLTWVLTGYAASIHGRIGRHGPSSVLLRTLLNGNLLRAAVWTLHGAVVLALLAIALDRGI